MALDFERASDIGEEVGGEGGALAVRGTFKYSTHCVRRVKKLMHVYGHRDPAYHRSGDQSA
jgi:hypothetical protein